MLACGACDFAFFFAACRMLGGGRGGYRARDSEQYTEKAQTDNEKDDGEEENMIFINLEFDGAVTSSPSLAVGYLGKRLSGVPLNLKRDNACIHHLLDITAAIHILKR